MRKYKVNIVDKEQMGVTSNRTITSVGSMGTRRGSDNLLPVVNDSCTLVLSAAALLREFIEASGNGALLGCFAPSCFGAAVDVNSTSLFCPMPLWLLSFSLMVSAVRMT